MSENMKIFGLEIDNKANWTDQSHNLNLKLS